MSNEPFVVIGSTGMLGRAVAADMRRRGIEFLAPTRAEVDLSKLETIDRLPQCHAIINCAAWTDVDGAEGHEAEATLVNGEAVSRLASRCVGGVYVGFSTDYVFDGRSTTPYCSSHERAPLNAYGRSKAYGEELLELEHTTWLNIRTSWLYAPWGKNFVLTMRQLLFARDTIKVVNDQRGRPTSVEHLARVTLDLIDRRARGHWHATDGGECTWYEFACEIKSLTGAPATIDPCTSDQFPRPAKRPAYSVLDLSKTEAELVAMPHWKDNLADVLRRVPEGITHA